MLTILIRSVVSLTASSISWLTASVHLLIVVSMFITVTVLFLSHCVPQNGVTALMLASLSGHTDVVQLLLSEGAKVDLEDKVRHNIILTAMPLCIADAMFFILVENF